MSSIKLPQGWKVMRVNRTYDERFLGSVYNGEDRLVAVLLQPEGEYLSREFEVHQWQEATLFLDSVFKGVSLTYREEE